MSKRYRDEEWRTIHPDTGKRTILNTLDRELTWYDIAVMTRAGQAKALGITKIGKGHLGVGAEADIAVYPIRIGETDPSRDYAAVVSAFQRTAWTIKRGRVVTRDGEVVVEGTNRTIWARSRVPEAHDISKDPEFVKKFDRYYTVRMANYPVQDAYIPRSTCIESEAVL
jgi:formylmethanofuran dehydrogenase subunit A